MVTRNQTCGSELAEAGLPDAAATAAARSKYFRERKLKSLVPGEVVNIGIILNCTGRAVDAGLPAYTDERLNEFVRGLNYCYNALNDDIISRTPVSQRSVANTATIGVNFYIEAIRRRFVLGTNEVHSAFLADDMSLPYAERSWDGYSLSAMQGTEVTDGPAQRDCGGNDPYRSDLFLNMWVARYVEYATSPTSFIGSYDHYLAGEIGTSGWAWKPRDSFQWYQAVWMQDFNVGSRFSPYDVSDSPPNFASSGPRGYGTGTVIAHELGHYLNLDHTWGGPDTTYPAQGPNTSCSVARGCYDLPTNDGSFDNSLLTNLPDQASGQDITIPRDEATECTVDGVVQNVPYSNYMNYADPSWYVCFTNSQVEVMRDCIQNPTQFSTHRLIGTKAPPVNCNMGRGGNNMGEMSAAGSEQALVGKNVVWEKSLVPPAPGPTPPPVPPVDPPTPEGHIAANAINMAWKAGMEDHGEGAAKYGRMYLWLPYESLYGTDNLRPSALLYHPNQYITSFEKYDTGEVLYSQGGWLRAYDAQRPLDKDSIVEVDGLKYTRCCIPDIGNDVNNPDPGFRWPDDTGRVVLRIKLVLPFWDDNSTYPATSDMYSREVYCDWAGTGDFVKSDKLPNPAYGSWG